MVCVHMNTAKEEQNCHNQSNNAKKINTIISIIILLLVILPNTLNINTNYNGVKGMTQKF